MCPIPARLVFTLLPITFIKLSSLSCFSMRQLKVFLFLSIFAALFRHYRRRRRRRHHHRRRRRQSPASGSEADRRHLAKAKKTLTSVYSVAVLSSLTPTSTTFDDDDYDTRRSELTSTSCLQQMYFWNCLAPRTCLERLPNNCHCKALLLR